MGIMNNMDKQNIASIVAVIENGKVGRDIGKAATTLIAMALSPLPILGGAVSIALQIAGNELWSVDIERHVHTIASEMLKINSRIDEIDIILSERVNLLSKLLAEHSEIAEEFRKLILSVAKSASAAQIIDEHVVNNNGGIMTYTNVIMENLRLLSSATKGATTTFENLTVSGSSKFDTDHARQDISNAKFSGRDQGFSSLAKIQSAELGQGIVETHVSEPGRNTGVRVTRVDGPNGPGGATLSISNLPKRRK